MRVISRFFLIVQSASEMTYIQGDHLSGKPGNVRNLKPVREFANSQGVVRE